jgi:hypothetical protein
MADFCGTGHILLRLRGTGATVEGMVDWPLQPTIPPQSRIQAIIAANPGTVPIVLDQRSGREVIGSVGIRAMGALEALCVAEIRPECPYCDSVACAVAGRCDADACGKMRCQHAKVKIAGGAA